VQGFGSLGLFANAAGSLTSIDVEQRKIRRAIGNQIECPRHVAGGADRFDAKTEKGVLEIDCNDRIILDDQNVIGQVVAGDGFHDLAGSSLRCGRCPGASPSGRPVADASR
jgi:hypothetical protein